MSSIDSQSITPASNLQRDQNHTFHLGYQPAIDGIRGLAVLAVLAKHLKLPLASQGALGVDVFFTLSGFLITVLLATEWRSNQTIHLGHFYLRRVVRLYPALLLMLLCVSFFTTAPEYILSSLTYSTNWLIALKIRPLNLELGHTWTLAIEEQYYLLWPLALRYLLRHLHPKKIILIASGLAIFSTFWRIILWNTTQDFWQYNAGTGTHADGLLFGSAFGLAVGFGLLPKSRYFQNVLRIVTVGFVIGSIGLFVFQSLSEGFIACVGISCVVFSTIMVISQLVVFPVNWLKNLLSFTPLVFVGEISYGLYLWQVPVLNVLNFDSMGLSKMQSDLIMVGIIFLISFLSYRYLEKPILRLKQRFVAQKIAFAGQ